MFSNRDIDENWKTFVQNIQDLVAKYVPRTSIHKSHERSTEHRTSMMMIKRKEVALKIFVKSREETDNKSYILVMNKTKTKIRRADQISDIFVNRNRN